MHILNLCTLLPAVAFAVPLVTHHDTISNNPIQIHKSPSSWWPWSPTYHTRANPTNESFTLSNTTWNQILPGPHLTHYRISDELDLKLKDLLMYLAGQEEVSWSATRPAIAPGNGHSSTVPTYGNVTAPSVLESTSALTEAEWCWDHSLSYFEQMTRRVFNSADAIVHAGRHLFHPGKFVIFTYCMGKADIQDPATPSVSSTHEKRDVFIYPLSSMGEELEARRWKQHTTNAISSRPISPAADAVEGHSISAFWSKMLPHHTPKEIEKFLTELASYYKQKKAGTHSSQTRWKREHGDDEASVKRTNGIPDAIPRYMFWDRRFWDRYMEKYPDYFPWEETDQYEKRGLSPTSTQTLVEIGKEEGRKAKPRFKLAKGALVRNGHWDGAMRSKNLDEDADCGLMDHAYLNERCVKSNLSE